MFNKNPKVSKIQHMLYGMLCYIDDFCKNHNITYFLGGGTCLGAIRESGFIVWDTDIDIMLPRPDYDKLINSFSEMDTTKYGLYNAYTDESCYYCYSKLYDKQTQIHDYHFTNKGIGIGIDIFPIDGVYSSKLKRKIFFIFLKLYYSLILCACRKEFLPNERFRLLKSLANLFLRNIKIRNHILRIEKFAKKLNYVNSEYAGAYLSLVKRYFGEKEIHERKIWDKTVYFEFEGKKFPVFAGYHEYLKKHYGNYMVPRDDGTQHSINEFSI